MKTLKQNQRGFLAIAAITLTLMIAGASQSYADHDRYNHYRHDDRGYWDHNNHYRTFDYRDHHRGYWDQRDGVRLWINI